VGVVLDGVFVERLKQALFIPVSPSTFIPFMR
jgi:hypothetical protein